MITSLSGKVLMKLKNAIILDVGDIGYRILLPAPLLAEVPLEDEFFCFTYLVMRDTEWVLYGFKTREDMDLFELLLSVQGLGPRAALAVLSAMEPSAIAGAIAGKQPALLTRIPGIGKKTAQRIVLDLKNKVDDYVTGMVPSTNDDTDAVSALVSLGYTEAEAQHALQGVDPSLSIEEKIFAALQKMSQ